MPVEPCHLRAAARAMRADDRREVDALGMHPLRDLWRGWRGSPISRAALIDGDVAAVWGVMGPLFAEIGVPWLITTDAVERLPWEFAREARREVRQMLEIYPALVNHVHAPYKRAVGFLRVLGFDVGEPEPMPPYGELFRRFEMRSL